MSHPSTKPVSTLFEHIRTLEATVTVCHAAPRAGAVHKLRSATRRLEAQLLLLSILPGLPPYRTEALALRRELRRLRRAAGLVRDYDVHQQSLASLLRTPSKTNYRPNDLSMRDDLIELGAELADRRADAANDLLHLLSSRQRKLAKKLESLRQALKEAEAFTLSTTSVLTHAHDLWQRALAEHADRASANGQRTPDFSRLSNRRLHVLRKSAKTARYLAESVPHSKRASDVAAHYQALQDIGGHWHDAFELAHTARETLGKKHPLTASLRVHRDREYAAFLRALERFTDVEGVI